ncbi:MAG: helix-turn-helix domain-containing protein [Candidatus Acidiferrales bacterium]
MASLRIVSTDVVPPRERFSFWSDTIQTWEQFVRSRFVLPHGRAFHGSLEYGNLGNLQLCRLKVGAHSIDRPQQRAWEKYTRNLAVVFQVKGHSYFEEDGTRISLSPGEWSISGMRSWSKLVFVPSEAEQLLLMLPDTHLHGIAVQENLRARSFSSRKGLGKLIYQLLNTTLAELSNLSENSKRSVAATIHELLNYSLLEHAGDHPSVSFREALHSRACAYVMQNVRDPALNIQQIAGALRCSKRYLHMVFANKGITIGDLIWKARLEGSRRDLQNPALAGRSIMDVAFSWGFNNYTHFSRKFKDEFEMSPRSVRAKGN